MKRIITTFAAVTALTGCAAFEDDDFSEEFIEAGQKYVALANELQNIPNTPSGNLPPEGAAVYNGYMNAFVSGPEIEATGLLGRARLEVDLDGVRADQAATITGSITSIYDSFEEPLSGSIAIVAQGNPSTNAISGNLAGALSQYGTTFSVDEPLSGAFRRPDGSAIFMQSAGDIIVGGSDAGNFSAKIVAEK